MQYSDDTCDIFCTVVDNYGDIGVSWRLARQLANEHGVYVRLWVDDLASFARLCPKADVMLDAQHQHGVEVRRWPAEFPPVEPAALVIEAFACRLPPRYVAAMDDRDKQPVWVNLEYLSAEDWVDGCHKLPSPHPTLHLTKYFFFPGFTEKTGGLLLERDLLVRRDAFQSDEVVQMEFWNNLGVPERVTDELRVSLFSYENEAMAELLHVWEHGAQLITCLVPEGRALPQIKEYFGGDVLCRLDFSPTGLVGPKSGPHYSCGNLHVYVLPFVEQEEYDRLLWACDINFVRGEDSCVRAQWAARPFVWHIYPQHDGVHLAKLEALRAHYAAGLPADAAAAVHAMWMAWNGGTEIGAAWLNLLTQRQVLGQHGKDWAQRLSSNNLALNLLDFSRRLA
ncbi:MAG: elongation factor P maturation arginine rhamnosyltransferase EarP [Sideroxydans sp.]|jgi:uncharacterized repeat protein (TIGR03837 family)